MWLSARLRKADPVSDSHHRWTLDEPKMKNWLLLRFFFFFFSRPNFELRSDSRIPVACHDLTLDGLIDIGRGQESQCILMKVVEEEVKKEKKRRLQWPG